MYTQIFKKTEIKETTLVFRLLIVVIREGLEPSAYCLEGSCSIQLSYRTIRFVAQK